MRPVAGKDRWLPVYLLVLWMVAAAAPVCHAHSMTIEQVDDQRVLIQYDGGGFSRRTVVTVLDATGHVLEEGKLDAEGMYDYGHLPGAYRIVADDGLGHRAEWVVGTTRHNRPKLPAIAAVWLVSGGIAWRFRRKKE